MPNCFGYQYLSLGDATAFPSYTKKYIDISSIKLRFVRKRLVRFFWLNYMLFKVLFCIIFAKMRNIDRVVFILSNENC